MYGPYKPHWSLHHELHESNKEHLMEAIGAKHDEDLPAMPYHRHRPHHVLPPHHLKHLMGFPLGKRRY